MLTFLALLLGGFELQGARTLEALYRQCGVAVAHNDVWGLRNKQALAVQLENFYRSRLGEAASEQDPRDGACLLHESLKEKLFEALSYPARAKALERLESAIDHEASVELHVENFVEELGVYFRGEGFDLEVKTKELQKILAAKGRPPSGVRRNSSSVVETRQIRLVLGGLQESLVRARDAVAGFVAAMEADTAFTNREPSDPCRSGLQLQGSPSVDSAPWQGSGLSPQEDSDEDLDAQLETWMQLAVECASIYACANVCESAGLCEGVGTLSIKKEAWVLINSQELSKLTGLANLLQPFESLCTMDSSSELTESHEGLLGLYAGLRIIYWLLMHSDALFKLKNVSLVAEYDATMNLLLDLVNSIQDVNPEFYKKLKFTEKRLDELMNIKRSSLQTQSRKS